MTTTSQLFIEAIKGESDSKELSSEVGSLLIQSSLMYFLASLEDDESERFEAYVEQNVADENFIDNLCRDYPLFEQILMAEMDSLKKEIESDGDTNTQ